MADKFYLLVDGRETGPYSEDAIKVLSDQPRALIKTEVDPIWRAPIEFGFRHATASLLPEQEMTKTPAPQLDQYGLPLKQEPKSSDLTQNTKEAEVVFFDRNGVRVTNARFIAHSKTFAMQGVTSVNLGIEKPSRLGPFIVGMIGIGFLLTGKAAGLAMLFTAIMWWFLQKPTWVVVLSSASGEIKALADKDGTLIRGIVDALNQSIIHRG